MSTTVTKTLDDAITEIRAIVNDSDVAFARFPNDLILTKINSALRDVYRYRPDAFIGNFTQGILSTNAIVTYDITDVGLATPWPIDDRLFYTPVVFYVAGMLDLSDDEFSDDGRAMTLLTSFRAELIGTGG